MPTSNPTAAQVHVALALLKIHEGSTFANDPARTAQSLVVSAMTTDGWTGQREDCPPFGALAEQNQAQLDHLSSMVERSANVNGLMESFIQNLIDNPDAFVDADGLRKAAELCLHNAALTAKGLPTVDKLPEEA